MPPDSSSASVREHAPPTRTELTGHVAVILPFIGDHSEEIRINLVEPPAPADMVGGVI